MSEKGAQRWLKCRSHTCCTRRRTAWWRWFAVEPQDLVVTHATQILSYHCDICLLDQSVRKLCSTSEFAKTFPNDGHPQKSQNRNNRLSETRTHITRSFGRVRALFRPISSQETCWSDRQTWKRAFYRWSTSLFVWVFVFGSGALGNTRVDLIWVCGFVHQGKRGKSSMRFVEPWNTCDAMFSFLFGSVWIQGISEHTKHDTLTGNDWAGNGKIREAHQIDEFCTKIIRRRSPVSFFMNS